LRAQRPVAASRGVVSTDADGAEWPNGIYAFLDRVG
jgi:hypothetical protein